MIRIEAELDSVHAERLACLQARLRKPLPDVLADLIDLALAKSRSTGSSQGVDLGGPGGVLNGRHHALTEELDCRRVRSPRRPGAIHWMSEGSADVGVGCVGLLAAARGYAQRQRRISLADLGGCVAGYFSDRRSRSALTSLH